MVHRGEGNGNPLQYSCLENPMDVGAWWAAVHGVAKSRVRLRVFLHFHALEKEVATHSSVPAWRIPGMGEPSGLPSMGSHRFGHDWSDLAAAAQWGVALLETERDVKILKIIPAWLCSSCIDSKVCIGVLAGSVPQARRPCALRRWRSLTRNIQQWFLFQLPSITRYILNTGLSTSTFGWYFNSVYPK